MNNHFVYKDALGKTSHHVQFKWLKRLCGGVGGDSVVSHWREDGVFWTVPEQPPPPPRSPGPTGEDRLFIVQKDSKTSIRWSEVDLVIFLFLPFSSFHIGVHVPLKIRATSTTLLN